MSRRDKIVIVAAVCLTSSVLPLDFSGAAAATPAIARELGGSPAALVWVVNAFMLGFGSCVMGAGALADGYGRKRVFALGTALFVLTSLGVSFAPSIGWLDALRVAQGVAAAATLSGGSAALAQEFEGAARARAFALLGTTFGVGLAFGPSIAGALIGVLGWRAVFLSGAVVGCVALVFGIPRMRESRDPAARGVDWPGTITFTAALALFTLALVCAPENGWRSCAVLALFAAAAALFVAFVVVEVRVERPMLDLSLFRYPRFVGVQALPLATACCYVVLLILLPMRFVGIEGQDETHAGTTMIALSAPMLLVPTLAAASSRWASPGSMSAVGLCLAAVGLWWLGRVAPGSSVGTVAKPMLLIGLGVSMPWGLMDGLSVSVVPKERAGMAAGIFGTTRVAGEGVVLAGARALLATLVQSNLRRTSGLATCDERSLAELAERVSSGDMGRVGTHRVEVVLAYANAFRSLCIVLAILTLASAAMIWLALRRTPRLAPAPAQATDVEPQRARRTQE